MNFKKLGFFLGFFLIVLFGAKLFYKKNNKKIVEAEITVELPEDFVVFYEKFHSDSIFQMKHILFPIEGIPAMIDSTTDTDNFKWTSDKWDLHKTFNNYGGTYVRDFSNFHGIITERIYDTGYRFEMRKRYSKIGDEWYLIYYAAMNLTSIYR